MASTEPPLTPPPNADQAVPFHLAIRFKVVAPLVTKLPPAYTTPAKLESVGLVASALTLPSKPAPSADHEVPSQLAMRFTDPTPPTVRKVPPTNNLKSESSAMALTVPPTPPFKAAQEDPFQRATRLTVVPPAVVKVPPAYWPLP